LTPLLNLHRLGRGAALLIGLLAAPVIFLAALRMGSADSLPGVTFDSAPVLAKAKGRQVTGSQPVSLTPTWDQGKDLYAPPWTGMVTAVDASAGKPLKSGDTVAAINAVRRIAYATKTPFYRTIASGDTGPDVESLNEMLAGLGYMDALPSDPTRATYATSIGIRDLAKALGVPTATTTFDPAWVVWLPASPFTPASLDLVTGEQAPAHGTTVATGQSTLTSATLAAANQGTLEVDPSAKWVVVVNDKSFAVDAAKQAVASAALAGLAALLPQPSSSDNTGSNVGRGGPGGANTTSGIVQRATPLDAAAIPSSSVMTGARGQLCAWVPDGKQYRAVEVTVADARAGITDVIAGLHPGDQLLANPGQVLAAPQCP
jgi:hypothetical protein